MRCSLSLSHPLLLFLHLLVPSSFARAEAKPSVWKPLEEVETSFRLISFKDIPPTRYRLEGGVLEAEVKASSAAWLLPLKQPRRVGGLSFAWSAEGGLPPRSAQVEASKAGDDAILRVGLILSGPAPTVPFFAPAWVKAVRDNLHLPSDRMLYLVVGAQHKPGEMWSSPYTDSIKQLALASSAEAPAGANTGSWQRASYQPQQKENIVGLWLMADGDNTGAQFKVRLKDLQFTD